MSIELTIIGLGQVGSSIGLALAAHSQQINRTGHDRSAEIAAKAQKIGAVDRVHHNLHQAVENADVVVLALPVDEIRPTLEQIAADLHPGAVVIDTSTLKKAVSGWALELLPAERYFVSISPALQATGLETPTGGIEAARADLFKNSIALITAAPGTDPDALRLAADLTALLGSTPLFSDDTEADGLFAAAELLPWLASAALVNAACGQPGWREARKIAGRNFAQASLPLLHPDGYQTYGLSALHNRDNAVRMIDDLIAELEAIKELVNQGHPEQLDQRLRQAALARQTWWEQRQTGDWEKSDHPAEMPTSRDFLAGMFGLRRKRKSG